MASHGPPPAEDSVSGQAYDARIMRRLLTYLKGYRLHVAFAVLLLLITTAVDLIIPLLIKTGIDDHVSAGRLEGLEIIALKLFVILVAGFFLRYLLTFLMQWIGQNIVLRLRLILFDHLQRMDVKFIDARPVGWLMTRITSDVQTLNEMFTSGIVSILGDVVTLIGIVVILLVLNLKLALVTFLVLPLLVFVVFAFRMKVRVAFREIREALAVLNGYVQEQISGVRTVQLFRREKSAIENFRERNVAYQDAFLKAIKYFALFLPQIQFTSALATALILLVGGLMIHSQELTWGALVAFLQYSERFFRPIRDLSEKYNTMQAAMAAAERVFWVLDTEPDINNPSEPVKVSRGEGKIEFDRVRFEYLSGEPVVDNISFKINSGETVAVVGATGAGKTTLISLLLRFWDVTSGSISLDGQDIRNYKLSELREKFGVVMQDVYLFSGSVAENVTLGQKHPDNLRLRQALEQANALGFIDALPSGTDEHVGERGARLSVGQRQLLAIATALYADPSILLLDEATAAVDTETEQLIQSAIDRLMVDRTTLVIAHRLSTIRQADRIIVLHKGRIRETGTHDELLEIDGIYAKLYRLQFAEKAAA